MAHMFVDDVLTAGQKFSPLGSKFPFPFEVVRVNPVLPQFTIRETYPDYTTVERVVRFSVFVHMARVYGLVFAPGLGFRRTVMSMSDVEIPDYTMAELFS